MVAYASSRMLALIPNTNAVAPPAPVSPAARPRVSTSHVASSSLQSPTKTPRPLVGSPSQTYKLPPVVEPEYTVQPSLVEDAKDVLRSNTRRIHGKVWTVPSSKLYPHQWAWDSAFIALGFAEFDALRGVQELQTLLRCQWDDGRVPHIIFHQPSDEYFPSPSYYGTAGKQNSSTISQPPVWTTAVYELWKKAPSVIPHEDWVELAQRCARSLEWFRQQRDPLKRNCIAIAHPWESGMDNSPAWDSALAGVDSSKAEPFVRRDQDKVQDASSERPTDAQYSRYASIVTQIHKMEGFAACREFFVYDPCMTALVAKAEDDLALLSHALGLEDLRVEAEQHAEDLTRGLEEHLWNEELERFIYFDAVSKKEIDVEVIGAYIPLCAPRLSAEKRDKVVHGLETRGYLTAKCPIPSVPPTESVFEACKYWRGPSWVNVNFLLFERLPNKHRWALARNTMDSIEFTGGFFEYFEARTGRGLGASHFSWTAALLLHWGAQLATRHEAMA